jgi:Kef-type K+ transport system membrane component KefB
MHDLSLLAIIWTSVLVASFIAHRTRLTPVLWYLFLGAVMVNLGFLPETMPIFIVNFAELGIIVIMFALGFEENTGHFLQSVKRNWGIALFGALVPFLVSYSVALTIWDNHNIALLCGLAMSATAVSLTMVSLKSEGLSKSPAAVGIMTSTVIDSISSVALVAILIPITTGNATLTVDGVLLTIGKVIAFFIVVTFFGAWLFPAEKGWLTKVPFFKHLNLPVMLAMGRGQYMILALLLIAVLVGVLAHKFGFHPAVGAYMAGLIIKKEYFDFHPERQVDFHKQALEMINNIAYSWIGPVFFVTLGSKLIFDSELAMTVLPYSLILFVCLFVGQVLSAGLAARFTGNFDWASSWMIGFGMLGRAELAFVVMDIAFVEHQIFTLETFYTLMLTAFLLNVCVPLTIRWWKPRMPVT